MDGWVGTGTQLFWHARTCVRWVMHRAIAGGGRGAGRAIDAAGQPHALTYYHISRQARNNDTASTITSCLASFVTAPQPLNLTTRRTGLPRARGYRRFPPRQAGGQQGRPRRVRPGDQPRRGAAGAGGCPGQGVAGRFVRKDASWLTCLRGGAWGRMWAAGCPRRGVRKQGS